MEDLPVAILCGGRGTRLQERTRDIPKPMVEIGDKPIVWHVVNIYAAHGLRRFLLLTGYRGDAIAEWAAGTEWPAGVEVECVDTGLETPTGGRIHRARERLAGGRFFATYADGVADVDLGALLAFHGSHGRHATLTIVQPPLPFGIVELDGDARVRAFREKPRSEHWINGGFFVFEPAVLEHLDETSVLERAPLERLAADGQLQAYRHAGFWDCMDTYKDSIALNDLWASGAAPWRVW